MYIRSEKRADGAAVRNVVREAFAEAPHSSGTEHNIVDELREKGALALSLVAVEDAEIVGHVAVSPVVISETSGTWFGLGPVSVKPSRQGQGFGSALIMDALQRLRGMGASGCVVLGDPNYYERFGFLPDPAVSFGDVPPPYFQVLSFGQDRAAGEVTYDEAFDAT
jgi:putative acetyltransferase